ncbi:MAG TPA: peptidase, partial [Firmicutes bacterium]|nr:peptidase [Bacillota bacterium]
MKKILSLITLFSFILIGCSAGNDVNDESVKVEDEQNQSQTDEVRQSILDKIDVNYSYNLARKMEEIKTNDALGYRTAGSDAEIQTGEMLYQEMMNIGLQDVTKDEFTLDTWDFEKAKMYFEDASGESYAFELGGYQTNFDTNGEQEFELVYAKKGTAADYENLDVEGKLVLVDINQRDEWWINYPALQAHLKGAAAIIAVQDGGYSEISDEALNTQDICGPDDAPAFSMSQKDANVLKEALTNETTITVTFDAKSEVGFDGVAYNVFGTIPGKDSESMILITAHMDSYYTGFQDDNAAIGIMMGIAKAIVDSGYQPEKTLVFTALAAEEWGVSNTRYDWSTGAYNQIFRVRPEWVGKVVANINFELPAYECESVDYIRSVYEYNTFLTDLVETIPAVDGVYKDGISVLSPTQTWSDDFSFAIAGVPSMRNEFSGDFMSEIYHSQFDNADTYNELAYLFHHQLYASIVLAYDQIAVAPLNFETRLNALEESINADIMNQYGIETETLLTSIASAKEIAAQLYKQVEEINATYKEALLSGNDEEAATLYQKSSELNANLLSIFKFCEDEFVRLTWEDESIFPHEKAQ